jgi:hypothetical protein
MPWHNYHFLAWCSNFYFSFCELNIIFYDLPYPNRALWILVRTLIIYLEVGLSEQILLPWYANFLSSLFSFYLTFLFANFLFEFTFHTSCYLLRLMANMNLLERSCLMVGWKNADVERNNMGLEWATWYVIVFLNEIWKNLEWKILFWHCFSNMSFHMYLWLSYFVIGYNYKIRKTYEIWKNLEWKILFWHCFSNMSFHMFF